MSIDAISQMQIPIALPTARPAGFLDRLRSAGIEPGDSEEQRLNKSLLMLATGLVSVATVGWVGIYWLLGSKIPTTLPYLFQLILAGNTLLYIHRRNFNTFRITQLGLFLFTPFVLQWVMGNVFAASGIVLWGLLAPIGAVLFLGVRESTPWFFAWMFLTTLTGFFDYFLADPYLKPHLTIPADTSVVFFALNFGSVACIIYALLRYSMREKNKAQQSLKEAHARLQAEEARAERLLLNILPGPVAERLKHSDEPIADGFADVSVMFADIVNFTQVAATMSPTQVFAMLNRIFSAFDELAERYGLEKIKTIGDAYMVAGGLNLLGTTNYSAAIVDMAVAMRDLLRDDFFVNSSQLEIRIGIGTGPIVAGVVGRKKFIYDLWGDTVNIASRITSEGVPGMVQCDLTTYLRLQDAFDFHEPQTIYLKGKGEVTVYRLIGRKAAVPGVMPTAA